jgi:hypothetical protein
VAVGLWRLHSAEIHDLLSALNEHRAQRPGDGTPTVTGFFRLYAFALGRAETASRQPRGSASSCGTASFDTFIKSTAVSAVMSATANCSPAI